MPRRGTRRTVARGIYEDAYGYEVRWRDRGLPRWKRFPLDTPLQQLKEFRKLQLQRAKDTKTLERQGSFVRDAARFLKARKHLSSFKSDRSHLRPWVHRFARLARWAVTHEHVRDALEAWARAGYSGRTLRHRLRVLTALYRWTDPGEPRIPTFGAKLPKTPPPPTQRRPSDELITAVAQRLRMQEMPGIGRLRDAKTRARFLVLATTGMRPAQLQRALPVDVSLDDRLWVVQPAKGDKGTVLYLNDEMLHATQLFIAADAWGAYDTRSFVKTLQRNGWPKGLRPYNLRHAVGQGLKRGGATATDISDHLGHRSEQTAREFYVMPDIARLRANSAKLEGRVVPSAFTPTSTRPLPHRRGNKRRK